MSEIRIVRTWDEILRIVRTWDEIPPVVQWGGEFFSTSVLEKNYRDMKAQLAAAEQRAEQAEKEVVSVQAEFVEILHNRQAKIEALKTAERNAVRECERIASRHIANAQHVAYQIRNRYPQHFEGE